MKKFSFQIFIFLSFVCAVAICSEDQTAITGGTLMDVRTGKEIEKSVILISPYRAFYAQISIQERKWDRRTSCPRHDLRKLFIIDDFEVTASCELRFCVFA
jgi:hypothetical protein